MSRLYAKNVTFAKRIAKRVRTYWTLLLHSSLYDILYVSFCMYHCVFFFTFISSRSYASENFRSIFSCAWTEKKNGTEGLVPHICKYITVIYSVDDLLFGNVNDTTVCSKTRDWRDEFCRARFNKGQFYLSIFFLLSVADHYKVEPFLFNGIVELGGPLNVAIL